VFAIPEAIKSEDAAPMLCGGVTVYAPLKQNGVGPGSRVGIIGVGGLGHMGIMFARALGADKVYAISRTEEKKADAMAMGADGLIATEKEGWSTEWRNSLDVIICTVSSPKMPFSEYLNLLDVGGTFVQVGAPDEALPPVLPMALIMKKVSIKGSLIGSPAEIREMLELAAERGVKPWIQKRKMEEANQVLTDFEEGLPRYRYVLEN
jgi:D-arabinose 1-dehydrogenase-like Zn-dependent alcohol dehydrogenase